MPRDNIGLEGTVTNRHSIAHFRLKSLMAPFFLSPHPSLNPHYAANRVPSIS